MIVKYRKLNKVIPPVYAAVPNITQALEENHILPWLCAYCSAVLELANAFFSIP